MSLKSVNSNNIYQIWDEVAPMLDKAMAHSGGEYKMEHLKLYLSEGRQNLLVVVDSDDKIIGALTVEMINFPDERVAFVTSVGGKMMTGPDNWAEFESWCRYNGATMIRGAAFESVARLWKKLFNVESRYIMVEKKL
jgi:hypothetical protein